MTQGRTGNRATEKGTAKKPFTLKTVTLPHRDWDMDALIVHVGFAASLTEARRLLAQGAVRYNGSKAGDFETVRVATGAELRVGKKQVATLLVETEDD